MFTGGLAGVPISGGASLVAAAKGVDEMQAAAVGKDTVVYNGARAAGLPPAAARAVDIAAAAEVPIAAARGIARAVPAMARGNMLLSGGELAAEGLQGAAKGAAQNPEQVAAVGAKAGAELQAAAATPKAIPGAAFLTEVEQATAARLQQAQPGLRLTESAHEGAEYVDQFGHTYDALGNPKASQFWNEQQFLSQINKHLLKSNDFTVIDLTGITEAQISVVRNYTNSLPAASQAKIIRIGF